MQSLDCRYYKPNVNLLALKDAVIEALKEFDIAYKGSIRDGVVASEPSFRNESLAKAAAKSVVMQDAYAIITGLRFDDAAEILREEIELEER